MTNSRKPRLVGFNHVAIEVGNIDEALNLYSKLFTFELRGREPGMAFIDLGDQFLAQPKDNIHYDDAIWQDENYTKDVRLRTSLVTDPRDGKLPPTINYRTPAVLMRPAAAVIRTARPEDDPRGISEFPHLTISQARIANRARFIDATTSAAFFVCPVIVPSRRICT